MTDMMARGMLPGRVQWSSNVSVAKFVTNTSCDSHEALLHPFWGQSHQWRDPCFAALIAAQSWKCLMYMPFQ